MSPKASVTEGKARAITAMALACLLFAACNQPGGGGKPPEPGDQAVAKVNGETIWASDVKREAVAEGLIGAGDPLDVTSDLFRQVLDEVIDTKVLSAEALHRGLDQDPLAKRRLEYAKERALEDLMVDSVVGKAVTKQAEDQLYQEFLKNQTPSEMVHLRQIVLATPADVEAARKELASGATFESVAMERSIDQATKLKAGDLGETTTDTLPQPVADAVRDARIGEIVGPVKVDAGYALIRVEDLKAEPPPSLESVRPQLIRFITYSEIKNLVLALRSHAKIETLAPEPPELPGAPTEPASAPAGANVLLPPSNTLPAAGNGVIP